MDKKVVKPDYKKMSKEQLDKAASRLQLSIIKNPNKIGKEVGLMHKELKKIRGTSEKLQEGGIVDKAKDVASGFMKKVEQGRELIDKSKAAQTLPGGRKAGLEGETAVSTAATFIAPPLKGALKGGYTPTLDGLPTTKYPKPHKDVWFSKAGKVQFRQGMPSMGGTTATPLGEEKKTPEAYKRRIERATIVYRKAATKIPPDLDKVDAAGRYVQKAEKEMNKSRKEPKSYRYTSEHIPGIFEAKYSVKVGSHFPIDAGQRVGPSLSTSLTAIAPAGGIPGAAAAIAKKAAEGALIRGAVSGIAGSQIIDKIKSLGKKEEKKMNEEHTLKGAEQAREYHRNRASNALSKWRRIMHKKAVNAAQRVVQSKHKELGHYQNGKFSAAPLKNLTTSSLQKESENKIYQGISDILEKNLEQMKENFSNALTQKAAEALEEKKVDIASSYFGTN